MSVNIIKGDMVLSYQNNELDAYAHQCNCFCRMSRGIAPLLAKANPYVRKVDSKTLEGDKNKMGNVSIVDTMGFSVLYNVYGQYHWSKYKEAPNRNTCYDSLKNGLYVVKWHLQSLMVDINDTKTLGLPLIGCGLAGGDWEGVVLPMIKEIFEDSEIEVTIFVLGE